MYNAKQEGLAEGLEQGEHNAKIETARKRLAKGLDITLILPM